MSSKALSGRYGVEPADCRAHAGFPPLPAVTVASPSPSGLSLNILLAEDEAAHAARLEKALLSLGHVVAGRTCDGQEACQLCQEIKPDLVLMDQDLPKLDGLQAAFVINRNQPLPVVLMASQARPGLVSEAVQAGVCACLFKPVEPDFLADSIEIAFRHFRRMRGLQSQVDGLRLEIKTRKLMGRASGILMQQLGVSEYEAVVRIHEEAKAKGLLPMEVARELIEKAHGQIQRTDKGKRQ